MFKRFPMLARVVLAALFAYLSYRGVSLAYSLYVSYATSTMWVAGDREVYMAENPTLLWSLFTRANKSDAPLGPENTSPASLIKLKGNVRVEVLDREFLTSRGVVRPFPSNGHEPNVFEIYKVKLLEGPQVGMQGWLPFYALEQRTPFL